MELRISKHYKYFHVARFPLWSDGFQVVNKYDQVIGYIILNPRWNKYVLCPTNNTEWSADCLIDVLDFMKSLQEQD